MRCQRVLPWVVAVLMVSTCSSRSSKRFHQLVHVSGHLMCNGRSAQSGWMVMYDVDAVFDDLMATTNADHLGRFELKGSACDNSGSGIEPVITIHHYCRHYGVAKNETLLVTRVPIPMRYVDGGHQKIVIELERYTSKPFHFIVDPLFMLGLNIRMGISALAKMLGRLFS